MLIDEIVASEVKDDSLDTVIRWQGGDASHPQRAENHVGQHRWSTNADVVELVTVLARQLVIRRGILAQNSILMHFDRNIRGKSGGKRRHQPCDHAGSMRADHRGYRK